MYDNFSLKKIILDAGFIDILECSYGVSSYISEISDVESTKEGVPSIYMEATKPIL